MRSESPLVAPVFRSDGQARLLAEVLLSDQELSITDLADRTGLAYPTVHAEVGRLLAAGILDERRAGRTRLMRSNNDSPLVPPLREILLIAMGPAPLLTHELRQIENVASAFIYGSFAARAHAIPGQAPQDIDVMIIGSPAPDEVDDACERVEKQVKRPVNATILSEQEWKASSPFIRQVKSNPTVPLIGEQP